MKFLYQTYQHWRHIICDILKARGKKHKQKENLLLEIEKMQCAQEMRRARRTVEIGQEQTHLLEQTEAKIDEAKRKETYTTYVINCWSMGDREEL